MPKIWKRGQEKKFCRELQLGKSYYAVIKQATNLAPYEDSALYSEYIFTNRLPFTNNPCTEDGYSASTLLRLFGPVYDAPPRGMRNIADPPPQVAGPVPHGYHAKLDDAELLALQASVSRGSDPHMRFAAGKRRR